MLTVTETLQALRDETQRLREELAVSEAAVASSVFQRQQLAIEFENLREEHLRAQPSAEELARTGMYCFSSIIVKFVACRLTKCHSAAAVAERDQLREENKKLLEEKKKLEEERATWERRATKARSDLDGEFVFSYYFHLPAKNTALPSLLSISHERGDAGPVHELRARGRDLEGSNRGYSARPWTCARPPPRLR
jgi:hypothetical protein